MRTYKRNVPDINTSSDLNKSNKYLQLISKLETLSPLETIKRGYTITKKDNKVITSINQVKKKDQLDLSLTDSNIKVEVL